MPPSATRAVLIAPPSRSRTTAADASAKGCNGYVNQLEWGCAAWDNNNGPQYPHYKKPETKPQQVAPAHNVVPPASVAARPAVAPNGASGIVAQGAGNIVAQGAGNATAKNSAGMISTNGGGMAHK